MSQLELPEFFKGSWNNALILTYGVNVPFFENALRPQFRASCRNIIILADGNQYLDASTSYAENELVRYLNHKYIVDGIFERTFHPKVILLTNAEKGMLLIGSGNLSLRGYASGGEMFTKYEFVHDETNSLATFIYIREFLQDLINKGLVTPRTVKHINHLFETTPWLFGSTGVEICHVRHNLNDSFIHQLQHEISNEPVRELWILSPFFDENAVALKTFLNVFMPERVILLVQTGCTSIAPDAVTRLMDLFPGIIEIRPFTLLSDEVYVHNKLYVFNLDDRSICLQGSPNLSQAAMLHSYPVGNIEVANLLFGSKDTFTSLFNALDIQPMVTDLASLDVSYKSESRDDRSEFEYQLTGGEWSDDTLCLYFRKSIDTLEGTSLKIMNVTFQLDITAQAHSSIELKLPADAISLLERPVPVALLWTRNGQSYESNPIFVWNIAALDATLEADVGTGKTLEEIGDLDLEDEDFERLLGELNAALVIDRRSIWQLAGKTPPTVEDEEEEGLRLNYADIDYEKLRQHPKIKQYQEGRTVITIDQTIYQPSRLQIILNSINSHFKNLVDRATKDESEDTIIIPGEGDQYPIDQEEAEEELEKREEEIERKRRSWRQRVRRILKGFIIRYLRGLNSPDFLELAGWDVVAKNYVIFSHILWRLFTKDWLEDKFIIESYLKIWVFFWGSEKKRGYFSQLDEDIKSLVIRMLRENGTDAQFIAALYYCNYLTKFYLWHELRVSLRDFLRMFIQRDTFHIDVEIIEDTWIYVGSVFPYNSPLPSNIYSDLMYLARFENSDSFLRSIERNLGLSKNTCRFEQPRPRMFRPYTHRPSSLDSLVIRNENALPDVNTAADIYQAWMRYLPRSFCRIVNSDSSQLFWYDRDANVGLYADKSVDKVIDLKDFPDPTPFRWEARFLQLINKAEEIDNTLSMKSTVTLNLE